MLLRFLGGYGQNLKKLNCDFLIAIGGEDTLGVANKLSKEGINVVGVPFVIMWH